jgi:hypothetical protein
MAGQQLSTGLSGQLSQHQILSQHLLRSLELLALPIADLDARIAAEAEVNPMLEIEELPQSEKETVRDNTGDTDDENDYEKNSVLADEWSDTLPLPSNSPVSIYFFALSQAPPELDINIAIIVPDASEPAKRPPKASVPNIIPTARGAITASNAGAIMLFNAAFVLISIQVT